MRLTHTHTPFLPSRFITRSRGFVSLNPPSLCNAIPRSDHAKARFPTHFLSPAAAAFGSNSFGANDNVNARRSDHRLADFADLERKGAFFKRRVHLAAPKRPQVSAARVRGAVALLGRQLLKGDLTHATQTQPGKTRQ